MQSQVKPEVRRERENELAINKRYYTSLLLLGLCTDCVLRVENYKET